VNAPEDADKGAPARPVNVEFATPPLSTLRKYAPRLIAGLLIGLLAVGTWAYLAWVERSTLDRVRAELAARQTTSVDEFEHWMDERARQALSWAGRGDTRELAHALLGLPDPTVVRLVTHPLLADYRQRFAFAQGREGLHGFFIVSPEGTTLAAMGDDRIGVKHALWNEPELVQLMRLQGVALSPFMVSDAELQNVGVQLDGRPVAVLIGVPIYLDSARPSAYFLIRVPATGLLALQGRSRLREGGMSYLVDNFGRLHADRTWLNLDLQRYGLASEEFRGLPYLFARDPGRNLLIEPAAARGNRASLPLTRSTEALQHGDGESFEPYRDHRGVEVVGTWIWSSRLNLGVITELPAREAFAPVALARQRVLMLGVGVGVAVVLLLLWRLRRTHLELKETAARAEAANRAKGVFLANMSHEIRTPLNAVLGIAHLLNGTSLQPAQRDYLQMISASGEALLRILNDILDYSKVEAGKLELVQAEFALSDMIDTLASIMTVNAAPRDLELVIGIDPEVPGHFSGDSHRLLQVLINLTGNAIKFTLQGEVVLNVTLARRDGDVATLRFEVRDSGVGISPEKQAHLFSPFMQADARVARNFGGTGLGLAICKRLVELMHGEIGVHSVEDKGSTFWFTVPLQVMHKLPLAPVVPIVPRHAMVVDDNDVARDFACRSLQRMGWTLEPHASGADALAAMRASLTNGKAGFDVVLMDWKMPGMDGLQTSKAIREIEGLVQPPIVIMVTAFSREQVMLSPHAEAVDAVIGKPATASKVLDAVMEAQAKRRGDAFSRGHRRPYAPARMVNALKGMRILLVEDNYINQQVARGVLGAEGALITAADNGQDAVDLLLHDPNAFDIVLMDVQMPVLDGVEATRRLRKEGVQLPIVAMSAGVTQEERDLCNAAGMNAFIAKPLEPQVVVQTIRHFDLRPPVDLAEVAAPAARVVAPEIDGLDAAELLNAIGGNRAVLDKLLARFELECGQMAIELERAVESGDLPGLAPRLHAFKGAAANMRAKELASQAERLDTSLREGDLDLARRLAGLLGEGLIGQQAVLRSARPASSAVRAR
jgi:signal transduction histidine kinase/DNA-binding response OmpR family regulator